MSRRLYHVGHQNLAMADDLISVIDIANQYGKRKQSIFKILKRLRIDATKRQGANSRGQVVAYITSDEARLTNNKGQTNNKTNNKGQTELTRVFRTG